MNTQRTIGTLPLEFLRRHAALFIGLLLAGLTLAIYLPATRFDFVQYDDFEYVVENRHVQAGLTWRGVAWAFGNSYASNWHPVTWLSHMLDVTLFGKNPGGHHLTSVVFHCVNTVLLFLVLRRLTNSQSKVQGLKSKVMPPDAGLRTLDSKPETPDAGLWPSALVAALFALHPLHVESVAWVSERKDVLSGFFFMLTLWAYGRYTEEQRGQGWRAPLFPFSPFPLFYFLTLLFFALGLMSKPMLVTLPFVLLLLDYWPLQRFTIPDLRLTISKAGRAAGLPERQSTLNPQPSSLPRLFLEKLPFFALCAASSIVTFLVQRAGGSVSPLTELSFPMRVANAIMSYTNYVGRTFWPVDLAVLYPRPNHWPAWQLAGATGLLLAITALVIWRARRWPFAAVGWFWFGGMLVPVIGLVQVGMQFMDDRYTYLPLIGLFIALVWGADVLGQRWPVLRPLVLGAGALACVACAAQTRVQLGFWADSEKLFGRAVAVTRNNYIARNNLGMVLARKGQVDEAVGHFQAALRLAPHYPASYNNLGNIAAKQGRFDDAVALFRDATRLGPKEVDAHHNLGNALAARNQPGPAATAYGEALRLKPSHAPAHFGLGKLLLQQGRLDDAARHFEAALQGDPTHAEAHHRLATILSHRKQTAVAVAHYREAVRLKPDWAIGLNSLAWILATHPEAQFRNGAEAVRAGEQAAALTKHADAQVLDTLAAAYAEAGRFADAVRASQSALDLTVAGDAVLREQIQARLQLYQSQQPYRQE